MNTTDIHRIKYMARSDYKIDTINGMYRAFGRTFHFIEYNRLINYLDL
jgi:hypothetical protein